MLPTAHNFRVPAGTSQICAALGNKWMVAEAWSAADAATTGGAAPSSPAAECSTAVKLTLQPSSAGQACPLSCNFRKKEASTMQGCLKSTPSGA